MGRTGIRGRGRLWRWGPNHRIAAVVSRWRRKYSPLGFPMDHILVDGKRVLEFIVVVRKDTGEFTLPGVSLRSALFFKLSVSTYWTVINSPIMFLFI